MNVFCGLFGAREVEGAPPRRPGADEERIPPFGEPCLQAVDALAGAEFDAEVEDVAAFLVDHRIGQTEFRDLRADHAAGFWVAVEHDAFVADWGEVAGDREGGRTTANQGDTFSVFPCRRLRQPIADVVFVIGRDSFQAANSHRLLLHAHAPAGRLTGAVASASENSGKHVRAPVDHVGVGIPAMGDQADVFGDGRMRRASPLAVHDFMEIVRRRNVGGLHCFLETRPATQYNSTVSRHSPWRLRLFRSALLCGSNPRADIIGYDRARLLILPSWLRPINHESAWCFSLLERGANMAI